MKKKGADVARRCAGDRALSLAARVSWCTSRLPGKSEYLAPSSMPRRFRCSAGAVAKTVYDWLDGLKAGWAIRCADRIHAVWLSVSRHSPISAAICIESWNTWTPDAALTGGLQTSG